MSGRLRTRLARQLDLWPLHGLAADARNIAILMPSVCEDAPGVLLGTMLPGKGKTWIVEDDSGLVGFAQVRPRRYVLGWELTRLHVRRSCDPEDPVRCLIQEILAYLQGRGIPRLFGRTPEESLGHDILLACGFTHLVSETVFIRDPELTPTPRETPVGLRYRMPQDAWPLRQLESSQTPLLISQLEGLTSVSVNGPPNRRWRRDEPSELVIERDGELAGWIWWTRARSQDCREHVRLGILTQQDETAIASALLEYALHAIAGAGAGNRIVLRLRDYQMPLHSVVADHGFREVARETLHLKHGRLQVIPKKVSRLLELAPRVGALTAEPSLK